MALTPQADPLLNNRNSTSLEDSSDEADSTPIIRSLPRIRRFHDESRISSLTYTELLKRGKRSLLLPYMIVTTLALLVFSAVIVLAVFQERRRANPEGNRYKPSFQQYICPAPLLLSQPPPYKPSSSSHIKPNISPQTHLPLPQKFNPPIPLPDPKPILKHLTEHTTTYQNLSSSHDNLWTSLNPSNDGFFLRKGPDGKVHQYGVAVFHQIHCLGMLRVAIRELSVKAGEMVMEDSDAGHMRHGQSHAMGADTGSDDLEDEENASNPKSSRHWQHCIDYLRQVRSFFTFSFFCFLIPQYEK